MHLEFFYFSNGIDTDENVISEEENQNFSGGLIEELASLFDGELKPVAPKAQKKVPMPAEYVSYISIYIYYNYFKLSNRYNRYYT